MPDLSEFLAEQTGTFARCPVAHLLAELPDDKAERLAAALAEPSIHHTSIAAVLDAWGQPATANAIGRHRRGRCQCPKP